MSDKLPPKILVVETDEVLNANLCNTIERYWFDVNRAKSSESAVRSAEVDPPNVAIISSRIQDVSATEMASQLKKIQGLAEVPIVFLVEQDEKVANYNSVGEGCSEVLCRPFTPNELMTTIRSLLRKSRPIFQDKVIEYSDIKMDLSTFKVLRGSKQVHLGPTEFKILQLFIQKPKNIYSRRQIIDYVWGVDKEIAHRTIDVHINRIRTLMKLDTDRYQLIKTIRSAGYCLD
ncbi:MAG: winged helix-turn-helix domain-containing protein [Rickettsiaceae bacterium]|nr:winged helix-turn-helix domain-containing protein [Rickettsiaceae bacterium]